MPTSRDWDRIKEEFALYRRTRAFRRHAAIGIGAVLLAIAVLVTRWALTSSGPAASMKKAAAEPIPGVPRELRGSHAFARTVAPRLDGDERFRGRVVAVPVIGTDQRSTGRVMVQGQVASEADLVALRDLVNGLRPDIPIEWQVLIVERR